MGSTLAGWSRREVLRSLASVSATGLLASGPAEPQLILHNANIWTVNPRAPRAQALAIADGQLLAVGTDHEVLRFATKRSRKIDMGGRFVLPGFIDAHCHPADAGIQHLLNVDCDLGSIAEILSALRARAAVTKPGEWVRGFKYDDTKAIEGRALTRQDLDAAIPDHPVLVAHRGGHTSWVNSRAFQSVGVAEDSADPPGGSYGRDIVTGRLTGLLRENAEDAFWKLADATKPLREQVRDGVKLISKMMSRVGITSGHDASVEPATIRGYQDVHEAGELTVRIYGLIWYEQLDAVLASGAHPGAGDAWVRLGGVKLFCDGSISERTAWLSEPYVGRPNDHGILVNDEDHLYPVAIKAHRAGWQLGTHANGDLAIDLVLRLYERLNREYPRRDPRFRLEHCTVVNDSLIRRMKALGAIPTPFSSYVYFHGEKMAEYGAERLNHMFALRSFLDAGIRATQASDYEASPWEPMMALQSEVTRTDIKGRVWGPQQRITLEEAIRVGTLNGAYASYEESLKGSLEPGKFADLVVLGRNPFKVDPFDLVNIPVEQTMVGGRWVWEA